jgi:type I restriction enzyme S subunit
MEEYELPAGWQITTFGEIASSRMGKTILSKELRASGLPVFSAGTENEVWGYIDDETVFFEKGTIIISARGTIGVTKLPHLDRFVSTQTTIAARPFEGVDPKFLNFQLNAAQWSEYTSTTAIPMLTISALSRMPVRVAPLNEQRRIVEKIETLFARLDKGEEALREVQKLLARYRQSVLKAAVTGQLTADWRAENAHRLEHGRDLLARILQTRREKWEGRGKYKEPAAPVTSDLPYLPEGWIWASLG